MAKDYRGTLAILKKGIQTFIKKTLQDQHANLCDDAFEYTEDKRGCSECDKNNLLPKHSSKVCPSQKDCLCKKTPKGRRPCPNGVCDSLLEGIIKAHRTLSPNLKNTNISRWSNNYWEVAKCFMAHDSESIDTTDLMDLLHIMTNDILVRKQLGLPEDICEQTDDYVNEVIQACKTIRRQRKINPQKYVEGYHEYIMRLLTAVGDEHAYDAALELEKVLNMIKQSETGFYFVLTDKILKKSKVDGKDGFPVSKVDLVVKPFKQTEAEAASIEECNFELPPEDFMKKLEKISERHVALADDVFTDTEDGIQLNFVQRTNILIKPETISDIYALPNDSLVETSMLKEIVGKTKDETVCNDVLALYSTNDEKDWFIDNILRWKFHFNDETRTSIPSSQEVLVLTLPFAQKLGIPVQGFCETASKALETQEDSVIVADLSHESIENNLKLFESYVKKHRLVRLIHKSQFSKYKKNANTVLMIGGIKELVLSDSESIYRRKNAESLRCCLYRCFRKIGPGTLETLTLKNLVFDENTTKVYVPFIDNLKTIKLKASKVVPVANFVQNLEIENVSFTTSETVTLCDNIRGIQSVSFLGQTKYILENIKNLLVWQYCPQLKTILTQKTTIGLDKDVTLNVQRIDFEKQLSAYFDKTRSLCLANELSCIVHHAVYKQMLDKFTRDDFEEARSSIEKQFILEAICFSLLQKHESYEDVYPARYENMGEIFLICITKEDRYLALLRHSSDYEESISEYVGFKTIEKSTYAFSMKASYCPTVDFDETIKNYHELHFDDVNEVVACHAETLLNEHRNLVAVAVSLGKATVDGVDVTLGPHIVLYVKAKSYIPLDAQSFPKELVHNKAINIIYPVDVREGYYVSMADAASNLRPNDKLQKLAMGCSIGGENTNTGATMGPLVEYTMPGMKNRSCLGFLTACHVFRKPEHSIRALGTNVVQPSDLDEHVNIFTGRIMKTPNKICGKVVACKFDERMDAALVRIDDRAPTMTRFITPTYEDLKESGFSMLESNGMPKYQNGWSIAVSDLTVRNDNANKRIVKYGKMTGLKRGSLMLSYSAVRLENALLPGFCPESLPLKVHYEHKLKGQMIVSSFPERSFFQKGDSGCGVFLVDNLNQLWCIGMGVGTLSDSLCVVTPIHTILDGLQSCLGIGDLRLKAFEPEEMNAD